MNNILVVFNYNAGRKQTVKYKKIIHKFLLKNGYKYKFVSIDELAADDFTEFDTIIAAGGDGTVNKTAQIAAEKDKTLAIIPSGTANLLAAKLGIPFNLKKNLKIIEKGNIKRIDVLKINGRQCVLRCGFGYDADIICRTPQSLKNKFGYFAYFIAGIILAFRLSHKDYEITSQGRTFSVKASCIITANAGNMYKNIISLADKSELDDGMFDVFILKTVNPIAFFYEIARNIFGIRTNNSRAQYFKTDNLSIKNNKTICHIDGEKTQFKGNIEVSITPQAVKAFSSRTYASIRQ